MTAAGFAHERAIHGYIDAYNRGDVEGMLVWLHPDLRFTNVSAGQITVATDGIDAFRTLAEQSARLFASRRQALLRLTPDADRVVVSVAFEGILAADLPGGPAAGSRIALEGETSFTFREGRIASIEDRS